MGINTTLVPVLWPQCSDMWNELIRYILTLFQIKLFYKNITLHHARNLFMSFTHHLYDFLIKMHLLHTFMSLMQWKLLQYWARSQWNPANINYSLLLKVTVLSLTLCPDQHKISLLLHSVFLILFANIVQVRITTSVIKSNIFSYVCLNTSDVMVYSKCTKLDKNTFNFLNFFRNKRKMYKINITLW